MLSRTHPLIQRVRALRRERKRRDEEGVLLAEGIHLVQEALRNGAEIEVALVSTDLQETPEGEELGKRLRAAKAVIEEVSAKVLDTLQDARSPQPIVLLVRRRGAALEAVLDAGPGGVPLV